MTLLLYICLLLLLLFLLFYTRVAIVRTELTTSNVIAIAIFLSLRNRV